MISPKNYILKITIGWKIAIIANTKELIQPVFHEIYFCIKKFFGSPWIKESIFMIDCVHFIDTLIAVQLYTSFRSWTDVPAKMQMKIARALMPPAILPVDDLGALK